MRKHLERDQELFLRRQSSVLPAGGRFPRRNEIHLPEFEVSSRRVTKEPHKLLIR